MPDEPTTNVFNYDIQQEVKKLSTSDKLKIAGGLYAVYVVVTNRKRIANLESDVAALTKALEAHNSVLELMTRGGAKGVIDQFIGSRS